MGGKSQFELSETAFIPTYWLADPCHLSSPLSSQSQPVTLCLQKELPPLHPVGHSKAMQPMAA